MRLAAVNLGLAQVLAVGERQVRTGIVKRPTPRSVVVGPLGLMGDEVTDEENHGGPDQAVYVYGTSDYDWWAGQLGEALEPGTFGENLTVDGLACADFNIGDRLICAGGVALEVTAARIPCGVFASRMNDLAWVKRFRQARRPGLYCRVVQVGVVQAGEQVRHEAFQGPTVSMLETFDLYYEAKPAAERLEWALAAPLAIRARQDCLAKLAVDSDR